VRALCAVLFAILVVPSIAACGGQRVGTTLYFLRASPRPVLEPVERKPELPSANEVLAALAQGPTQAEGQDGLRPVIQILAPLTAKVRGRTAVVRYSGPELTQTATAAIVFSLTELEGIEQVSLQRNGHACCIYDLAGKIIDPLTRHLFRGWSREPCRARKYANAVACSG
jgi:spore germination protein GerM